MDMVGWWFGAASRLQLDFGGLNKQKNVNIKQYHVAFSLSSTVTVDERLAVCLGSKERQTEKDGYLGCVRLLLLVTH